MHSQNCKILQIDQNMKSDKLSYIIYVDLELLIEKIDGCANNPRKASTTKIGEHIHCGYSMLSIWAFDNIENKRTLYRGKDCMKKLCTTLRELATTVINFE